MVAQQLVASPEEVYLACLTYFCVKPPDHDGMDTAVDMKLFTREMALFLLKELRVRLRSVARKGGHVCRPV